MLMERGKEGCVGGGEGQLEHWQLLKQEGMLVQAGGKLDGQLPAVCAQPLQLHRDGGVPSQVLVARMVLGKDGEDSNKSLMVEIPFLDEIVKVADSPASSNSSTAEELSSTWVSFFVQLSEPKKPAGAHKRTSSHFNNNYYYQ